MRMLAAHTPADRYPPPYINVSYDEQSVVITVRDEPTEPTAENPASFGAVVQMRMTMAEWRRFLLQALEANVEVGV